jgi:hypothetical protein
VGSSPASPTNLNQSLAALEIPFSVVLSVCPNDFLNGYSILRPVVNALFSSKDPADSQYWPRFSGRVYLLDLTRFVQYTLTI